MNPNRLVQSVVAVVAAVWLFCIGLVVGTRRTKNKYDSAVNVQPPITQATGAYSPVYPTDYTTQAIPSASADASVPSSAVTNNNQPVQPSQTPATDNSQQAPQAAPTDRQEIVNLYINAVNKSKDIQNFSLTRQDTLSLVLDDITGGSLVASFGNKFVESQAPKDVENLVFQNGVDVNGSGETPLQAIPPVSGYASLDPNALVSATAAPNAYGGYTISLALADETQTISAPAKNHSSTMEVVDINALGFPSGTNVEKMDVTYSGATIVAETDSQGRIATMTHHLPVSHAEGAGSYSMFNITAQLHGEFTCVYTLTY